MAQLDPVEDMDINDEDMVEAYRMVQDLEAKLQKNPGW